MGVFADEVFFSPLEFFMGRAIVNDIFELGWPFNGRSFRLGSALYLFVEDVEVGVVVREFRLAPVINFNEEEVILEEVGAVAPVEGETGGGCAFEGFHVERAFEREAREEPLPVLEDLGAGELGHSLVDKVADKHGEPFGLIIFVS